MKNHVLSSLVFVFFFGFATAAWAGYTFEGGVLTVVGETDLKGESLIFENITSMTGTGSFTDSAGGGVLTLGVAEGVTINNGKDSCLVQFTGGLKLAKTGTGTLAIAGTDAKCNTHSFTNGLEVRGGTLKTDKYGKMDGQDTPFGRNAIIDVYPGATLDLYGCYDLSSVTINLRGGSLTSSRAVSANAGLFALNVAEDSTNMVGSAFNYQGNLNLNGKTLTLILDDEMKWAPRSTTAGMISLSKSSGTSKGVFTIFKDVDMSKATLSTSVKMNIAQEATLDVLNYVADYNGSGNTIAGVFNVHGTLTPSSNAGVYPCVLLNGAMIDLSRKMAAWPMGGVTIADGAKIGINIGNRTATVDKTQFVSWAEGTEFESYNVNKTFHFVGNNVEREGLIPICKETGVFVAVLDTKVVSATWTGKAEDGKSSNPMNWSCVNNSGAEIADALPDEWTPVTIPYSALATLVWPIDSQVRHGLVAFSGEKPTGVTLTRNLDWTGLGPTDFPFSMDLARYELKIQLPNIGKNETSDVQRVTSSSVGGRLCVSIAEGDVYKNTTVSLAGSLTLVKDGPGEFDASVDDQSYSGGTVISRGKLKITTNKALANGHALGSRSEIVVNEAGVLDVNNKYKFAEAGYSIVLNGGQIYNDGIRTGATSSYPMNPSVVLESDSTFRNVNTNNFAGTLNLNGHVLATTIGAKGTLRWSAESVTAGTLAFAGEGQAILTVEKGIEMRSTELRMAVPMTIAEGQTLTVGDYVVDYAGEANVAAGELVVTGSLKPNAAGIYPCTLANGAAIDLRDKKGSWSLPSSISFAENAAIKILVTEPENGFKEQVRVVSWTDRPTTPRLKFVLDNALRAKGYSLARDENGLYVERRRLVLLFL